MKHTLDTLPELPNMNARADRLLSEVDTFITVCEETFKDTGFSLDARWDLYLKVEKLLPVSKYLSKSSRVLTDSPYDDLFPDGRGMLYNSDLDEQMMENGAYVDEQRTAAAEAGTDFVPDRWDEKALAMFDKRDEWREAVLAEGVGGFVFDW